VSKAAKRERILGKRAWLREGQLLTAVGVMLVLVLFVVSLAMLVDIPGVNVPVDRTQRADLGKTTLTALLAILAGGYVALFWNVRQKRRESDLATTNKLYELFGQYVAIYRLWNQAADPESPVYDPATLKTVGWDLLKQASAVEGDMEALLTKLTTERRLDVQDQRVLALFRQADAYLRRRIQRNKPFPIASSEDLSYEALRRLLPRVARIVDSGAPLFRQPDREQASTAFLEITNNHWEEVWGTLACPCTMHPGDRAWFYPEAQQGKQCVCGDNFGAARTEHRSPLQWVLGLSDNISQSRCTRNHEDIGRGWDDTRPNSLSRPL
jgi:hypothetical protein